MATMPETPAIIADRHCTVTGCRKCRARSRWLWRRAWRSRKNPSRNRDRKR